MYNKMDKLILRDIPSESGCYIFRDSKGSIIYIGKAKNLDKRVRSYFSKRDHDRKTESLIRNISSVEFISTTNEIEALILENNLIKKHKPKYNIELKDAKSYTFIEQTKEEFPRFRIYRGLKKEKDKTLFGPFTSARARDDILEVVNKTFRLRTCRRLPKKACIRYSIGICSGPCIDKISMEDYLNDVNSAKQVINGKIGDVIINLEEKMRVASKRLEFERAKDYRDKVASLRYLEEKQNVERRRKFDEDIINYIVRDEKVYLIVFNVYKGTLNNRDEFVIELMDNFLEEFIKNYYDEREIPKDIIIPEKIDSLIEEYLTKKKGSKVRISVPLKGERKDLMNLVKRNIEISFFGGLERLDELKRVLNLQKVPSIIECFDVSHLSGTNIVASMVQFNSGKPDKGNYRRYKIKSVNQNDDFASIKEVVKRRYSYLKREGLVIPDLVLIDGGKGQLNSAIISLLEVGVKIPIVSLAKEFEEIYIPGVKEPLRLDEKNKARLLLQEIRDEAHRFAISYNRLLKKKEIRK
jgi:excinuclease ABC subunit C